MVRISIIGLTIATTILLFASKSEGLGWPGLPESTNRYELLEHDREMWKYLFTGSALQGLSSGLLQGSIMALAYDIPSGNTELHNPEARVASIMDGTAKGWMIGPAIGGFVAVIGGPFLALLLATVVLTILSLFVLLWFPVTERRILIPEVNHLLFDETGQYPNPK